MFGLISVLLLLVPCIPAITVPVDDIPLERPPPIPIQNRKFTVDNRGYAHVPQELNESADFLAIPYRNGSSQDPRNRRIVPVMTFFIPTSGGGGAASGQQQYYHPKQQQQQPQRYNNNNQYVPQLAVSGKWRKSAT